MKTSDKYLSSDAALFNILDNSYLHVFILLLISSILIFWKLWYGSLADWDELLYANIAKSLVLPEIPDYMMFKPSLFYLLIAFSYKLFGINVLSTRLITAIFGIATVIMVYFLGKELYDKKTGFFAAILLLTSQLFILYSRLAMKDVPAAFFILGSLFFFYRAFKSSDNPSYDHTSNDDDNNSKTLMHILSSHLSVHYNTYLFFLFVLFAVGIKHMLGLLPLIVVTLYVFLFDFKKIKLLAERQVIISIIIFFLIIITWITLKISTGSFQIIDYSIDHFMIGVEGHDQDWTYYIDVFKSGSFMFVWFLPLSLLYYVLTSFKIISFRKKDYLFPDRLLFIYVISFSIILFFYQTRLPWYLISFVPVFSIMIIVMFFRVISLISYFSGAYSKNILLILCSILLLIILFG